MILQHSIGSILIYKWGLVCVGDYQHYSGETGATYLSQICVFTFLQFVSAATSLAAGIAAVRGLANKSGSDLGNFYKDFIRCLTRVLLPLSFIAAGLFLFNGMSKTLKGPHTFTGLQGDTIHVARGSCW